MCQFCYKKDDDNQPFQNKESWGGNSKKTWIGKSYIDVYRKYLGLREAGIFLFENFNSLDNDISSYYVKIPIKFCPWCGERVDLPKIGKLVKATINDSYYNRTIIAIGRVVRCGIDDEFGEYGENGFGGYLRFWREEDGRDFYIEELESWEYLKESEND